jgi:hypothetical protein
MRLRIILPEGTSEWESHLAVFRVGRADTCALRFEGELAKYASWEHAEFSVDRRGVNYVSDLGSSNGTYVNGERISERTPLAVGTVVHIGSKGPRLDVLELSPCGAGDPPVVQNCGAGVPPARQKHAVGVPPSAATATTTAAGPATWLQRNGLAVGLAVALVVVVAIVALRKEAAPEPAPAAQAQMLDGDNSTQQQSARSVQTEKDDSEGASRPSVTPPIVQPPVTEPKPSPEVPQPNQNQARAFAAYRLIVAEDPQSHKSHPGPGAIAVADHTLLTTATLAVELAKMVHEKKYALKAVNPADGTSVAIRDLRVHPLFQKRDPAEQLFFDAALLYTDEPLTNVAELATGDELEQLEMAQHLTCIAADHDRTPLEVVEELVPTAHQGIILKPHFLGGQPRAGDVPGLLTLFGRFQDWYFGSPIINSHGHLVAMYCEPTADDESDTHFAKVIDPELIKGGLNRPESSLWVPITTASKTKEPEK